MESKIIIYSILTPLIISLILGPFLIPLLRKLKIDQSIRDDGPQEHLKKAGTPTLGAIIFLIALIITVITFSPFTFNIYLLLSITLGFSFLGFLDDLIKIVKRRNLGLTASQKLFGQIFIALILCYLLYQQGFDTRVFLPGSQIGLDLGWLYFLLIIFWVVGFANALNITDGVDGLLAGSGAITFGAYTIIAIATTQFDIAIFSAAMVGALLGFLAYNIHPAKVFMGDTGSLGLGAALATISILTKTELLLIIIGGVYVIETLSVIIQVFFFKTKGKRIFKMSPIHHHFELSGWSEWKVVTIFWTVGLIFAALGIYIEVLN